MYKTTDEGWDHIETCNSGAKGAVLNAKKPLMRSGTNRQSSLWILAGYFAFTNQQAKSGTHRDL